MSAAVVELDAGAEPDIRWAPSTLVERGVVALVLNATADSVHWGDGTSSPGGDAPIQHRYTRPGAYRVTAVRGSTAVATGRIVIRDGLNPDVAFTPKPGAPNVIVMTTGGVPPEIVGSFTIDWGDGSPKQTGTWLPDTGVPHTYHAGTYTVTVLDRITGRSGQYEVTATDKVDDPGFTVAKGADAMTVELTVSHLGNAGKDLVVDWGDFTRTTIPSAEEGDKASHTYAADTSYVAQLVYADGSTEGSAQLITVPFPVLPSHVADGSPIPPRVSAARTAPN